MAHQKHKRGREKNKKKTREEKKIQEKKNCNSVIFFFFLKERFTDTGGWTTLMPQRKMDFKSRASSHTVSLLQKVAEIQET